MKINKLGIICLMAHTIVIVTVAFSNGIITNYHSQVNGAGTFFLNLVIIIDTLPFILLGPLVRSTVLTQWYFAYGWFFCLHFVILGGIQYYLIGVLLSFLFKKRSHQG